MLWKVYYLSMPFTTADFHALRRADLGCVETFSNEDGGIYDAPKRGVAAIQMIVDRHTRLILRGRDFYVWDTFDGQSRWEGVDQFGLYDYLLRSGPRCVLFGQYFGNNEFNALLSALELDPDFSDHKAFQGYSKEKRKVT